MTSIMLAFTDGNMYKYFDNNNINAILFDIIFIYIYLILF